jgi:hypothetical protein
MGLEFVKDIGLGIVIEVVIMCFDVWWFKNNENNGNEQFRKEFVVVWNHILNEI